MEHSEAVMEDWRNYLRINGKSADILFEIIEKAIMVAASHYPLDFQIQREKIAKTLFSLNSSHSHSHSEQEINIGCMKMSDDPNVLNNHTINHTSTSTSTSHEDTKMVTSITDEILRIKQILDTDRDKSESESQSVVMELLLKLEDMGLSYKNLEATKIGRSVSRFQNKGSREVRLIATRLIKMWRAVADEWFENQQHQEEKKQKEESIIKGAAAEKKQMDSTCTGIIKKESSTTTTSRSNVVKIKIIKRDSDKKAANMEDKTTINNIEKKLEATKRKLHQRYEEVENAKRQRKIQVVELHQLKNQGFISSPKTKNQNRKSLKMW